MIMNYVLIQNWIDYLLIEKAIESNQCRGDRRTLKSNYRVGTLHKPIINPMFNIMYCN